MKKVFAVFAIDKNDGQVSVRNKKSTFAFLKLYFGIFSKLIFIGWAS